MKAKRAPRLSIDIRGWEVDSWACDLAKAVEIRHHKYNATQSLEIEIRPNIGMMEKAARKVAKEAIEAFFNDDTGLRLGIDGLEIEDPHTEQIVVIPWQGAGIFEAEADIKFEALPALIQKIRETCELYGVAFPSLEPLPELLAEMERGREK